MKLTTEQKRYRKSVIFDNEIKMLQEKINNLGLSSPLTIKKLYFDYNKSQNHRSCCVIFKETFTVIHSEHCTKKKEKVNKWASVNMFYDGSGITFNGIRVTHRFGRGGVIYHDFDNEIEDTDIEKVCNLLANEYFLWVHWTDHHVAMDIERCNRNVEKYPDLFNENNKFDACKYFMYLMWKRLDIAFDGIYTQYTLNELIQKYQEQVERGLIIDCPFEDGKFPFNNVNEVDIKDIKKEQLIDGGIYG